MIEVIQERTRGAESAPDVRTEFVSREGTDEGSSDIESRGLRGLCHYGTPCEEICDCRNHGTFLEFALKPSSFLMKESVVKKGLEFGVVSHARPIARTLPESELSVELRKQTRMRLLLHPTSSGICAKFEMKISALDRLPIHLDPADVDIAPRSVAAARH